MKRRLIALFIAFSMLLVFLVPTPVEAVSPFWKKFIKIIVADAIGAGEGYLETGTGAGAIIGGVIGSLGAGISSGEGSPKPPYNSPIDVEESVGLHHNLALNHIIGDKKVGELKDDEINKRLEEYLKESNMEFVKINPDKRVVNVSKDFQARIDKAMEILEEEGKDNPEKGIKAATSYLREGIKEIPFREIDAETKKRMESKVTVDDIAYMIIADVLESSFEFWGGKQINMNDDYNPIPRGLSLSRFWDIVRADIKGAIVGYENAGVGGAVVVGAISSAIAASKVSTDQGNWDGVGPDSIGSLHNEALIKIQKAEDPKKAALNFLKDKGLELNDEGKSFILQCNDPGGCTPNPFLDWLKNKKLSMRIPVSDGFVGNLENTMNIVFNENKFEEVKIKEALNFLLNESAKASGMEAKVLTAEEYKVVENKLKAEGKPFDIIYASIFVDVFLHSSSYWMGDNGPFKSIDDVLAKVDKFVAKPIEPPKDESIEIILKVASEVATVNGQVQVMDVKPVVTNQRILVPLRFIGEALKADVDWLPKKQEITYELEDMKISLFIGQTRILVNGVEQEMDVEPFIVNNRTLVPIRMISETLGFDVIWNQADQTVTVTSKK